MKSTRDYLSISQVRQYLKCGMQYYYRYFEGIKSPPTGSMIRGLSVDVAANNHFSKKIENNKGLPKRDFVDIAVAEHESKENEVDFSVDALDKNQSKDRVSNLAKTYHGIHGKAFNPQAVQVKLEVVNMNGDKFLGYADLITVDGIVVDNKVRKRHMVPALSRDIQLVKYAGMSGKRDVGIAVVADLKEPRAYYYQARITDKHIEIVDKKIDWVKLGIANGIFLPAPEGSWYCSEKWCSYWNICEFGK